jgi:hypothetical protein
MSTNMVVERSYGPFADRYVEENGVNRSIQKKQSIFKHTHLRTGALQITSLGEKMYDTFKIYNILSMQRNAKLLETRST